MANYDKHDKNIIECYVCSNCFEKIHECDCMCYPASQLIFIDPNIQEHVRVLNGKGYRTTTSCESHRPEDAIYILFSRYDGIEGIEPPEGFTGTQFGTAVEYRYPEGTSTEDYEALKKKQLDILLNWCKELPERKNHR